MLFRFISENKLFFCFIKKQEKPLVFNGILIVLLQWFFIGYWILNRAGFLSWPFFILYPTFTA